MTGLSARRFSVFSPSPTLSSRAVHIWLCRAASPPGTSVEKTYRALLPSDELARCDRAGNRQQYDRFLLTRVLLRTVLSQYASVEPTQWRFSTDASNKPCIESPNCSLSFNLSHSGEWIVCAICEASGLGVDVEYCEPRRDLLRLAQRFFHPREFRDLQLLAGSQRVDRFYDYWTLKESWLKATGQGIAGGLDQIVFELHDNGSLDFDIYGGGGAGGFDTWLLDSSYRLSLCCPLNGGGAVPVKLFEVEPLVSNCESRPLLCYSSRIPGRAEFIRPTCFADFNVSE